MGLSRSEFIGLGAEFPTQALIEWAGVLSKLGARHAGRLVKRGATPAYLGEIDRLADSVAKLETQQEIGKKDSPAATRGVEEIRAEAVDWWREARESAKVEFGTDPDQLSRFRTGVRVGGSTPLLVREIRFLLPVLSANLEQLAWLGVDEAFVKRGEMLAGKLHDADLAQEEARKTLPPKTAELLLDKGKLYDLVRKLVRLGRLEFRKEPETASQFNYEIVRRGQVGARAARARTATPAAR